MDKWLSLWSAGQKRTLSDFEEIKKAGFTGVEIWAEHLRNDDYFAYAKEVDLEVGLHLPFHDLNLATPFEKVNEFITTITTEWLERLGELGGGHAVIHGGSAMASEEQDKDREVMMNRLSKLNKIAEENNVELLFENQIPDSLNYVHIFPSSVDEWIYILRETNTKACLDTGHLAILGAPLKETIKKLGDRLKSVHYSDNDSISDLHLLPGEGNNKQAGLVGALKEINYDGPIVFEVNPYKYSLEDILKHPSVIKGFK